MSRFFKRISDSESESSSSDEEQAPQTRPAATTATYGFSDDEEETKRVVRSAKDKHYDTLKDTIKQVKNGMKIKDFTKILTEFDDLAKKYIKAKPVVDKEENGVAPKFYVRTLVQLEDLVNEVWNDKDARKNMNKNNSKALVTTRQKLKKYIKDFEAEIATYRENPDDADGAKESGESDEEKDSDASAESSDEDEEELPASLKEKKKAPVSLEKDTGDQDDDEDSDESDWGTDSDESSSSSDDGKYEGNLAMKFLKQDKDKSEPKKREKKTKESRRIRREEDDDEDDGEGKWEKVRGGVVEKRERLFPKDAEITVKLVADKIIEVLAMRGKKKIDRSEQLEMLNELRTITDDNKLGTALELKIIYGIISCMYDYSSHGHMKQDNWQKCIKLCTFMVDTLIANPQIKMSENIAEDTESFDVEPLQVHGCPLTLIERLDEEFVKILQGTDPHSTEYIERLKDESRLCDIIERLQAYLEKDERGSASEVCRVYVLRIDHVYYKFDRSVFASTEPEMTVKDEDGFQKVEVTVVDASQTNGDSKDPKESSLELIDRLCKYIYSKDSANDRIKTQAVLSHIYHLSLHDRWYAARDLMLMTNLQQNIHKADIPLQVLYNRALVQLGLCGFRAGAIRDAHTALLDIQIMGRARELLAQGMVPRATERTPEQEKLEKRRQIPFHKHINIELLECVYLVSAMLLEIPDVAANEYNIRKKIISRSFYNQLRKYEDQPLVGVPESMREHVVAASKAMRVGNWQQCTAYIINEKMNAKVWNLFHQADRVRDMLRQKVREESVRAYLFTYSNVYDSISIEILAEMFELDMAIVHSVVSKMIINEELMASLDEPTQSVVMHRTEPSRIQGLSLQLADKINNLVEQNERLWELKFGTGMGGMLGGGQGGRGGYGDHHGMGGEDGNQRGHGGRGRGRGGGRGRGRGGYDGNRGNRQGYRNRGGGHHQSDGNEERRRVRF